MHVSRRRFAEFKDDVHNLPLTFTQCRFRHSSLTRCAKLLTHAKKLAFSDVRVKLAASMAVEKAAFSMSIRRPGSVSL